MKGGLKIPSLQVVNAAWLTARAGVSSKPDRPDRYPMAPDEARPFYQHVVLQALAIQRDRKRLKIHRPLTSAERRAIKLTRLWLEFGDL